MHCKYLKRRNQHVNFGATIKSSELNDISCECTTYGKEENVAESIVPTFQVNRSNDSQHLNPVSPTTGTYGQYYEQLDQRLKHPFVIKYITTTVTKSFTVNKKHPRGKKE